MPLKMTLKAGEEFYINGALLRCDKRTQIAILSDEIHMVREKRFVSDDDDIDNPEFHRHLLGLFQHFSGQKVRRNKDLYLSLARCAGMYEGDDEELWGLIDQKRFFGAYCLLHESVYS